MGFRIRKSIKIMPGVRINLSKTGTSLSLGGKGATVNFSKRGTRTTVGIPGTGLSYTETTPNNKLKNQNLPALTTSQPSQSSAIDSIISIAFYLFVAWLIFKLFR